MNHWKLAVALAVLVIAGAAVSAQAQASFQLTPFTYDPNNLCDVESGWVTGGLPDGGSSSYGIFLKKGCTTATEASAGVDITSPLEGGDISALTELNFDYKNDGHCGAGAPRFNVTVDGNTYFLGCAYGTHTAINSDWTHVEYTAADFAAAGIPTTGTLTDLTIIFDEGTDTSVGGGVVTPGQVLIDNVSVNGEIVGAPTQPLTKDDCKNGGWMRFTDPSFRNQGQCVSSVVGHRGRGVHH